ncbi:fimbrial protein [Rahnella aquatilis]|uniref:fimbrial protein n=1 Tax=Rahnella aquatilis TaxID=34038 RepID=UPI0009DDFDCE|nr:fimbrial protein [Rahnella aquatilis]
MTRITPLLIFTLLSAALSSAKLMADDAGNHLQMTFSGRVNISTCRVIIPEKIVVMPSALIADFSPLKTGDLFAEKEFSVSVADCNGGEGNINQVVLYFEPKTATYDDKFPAFKNDAGDAVQPRATGIGAVITDERDDRNVTGNDQKPVAMTYDTEINPLGSEYKFIARYMKTSTTVTSGYFSSDVIITATYQ